MCFEGSMKEGGRLWKTHLLSDSAHAPHALAMSSGARAAKVLLEKGIWFRAFLRPRRVGGRPGENRNTKHVVMVRVLLITCPVIAQPVYEADHQAGQICGRVLQKTYASGPEGSVRFHQSVPVRFGRSMGSSEANCGGAAVDTGVWSVHGIRAIGFFTDLVVL